MSKLDVKGGQAFFWCEGCDGIHSVAVDKPFSNGAQWTWNGDEEKPTFSPSVLVNKSHPASRCHSFVENGNIRYLGDCYHELKNKTVPLLDYPDDLRDI